MRWVTGLLACLALFLMPLGAAGPGPAPEPSADAACVAQAVGPPCGYIQPFVNIDVEAKKVCKKADHSDCMTVPEKGASVTFKGKFQYYWKLSEDLTYPPDAQTPIHVTFSGVASNPKWLTFKVDPKELDIAAQDLINPMNMKVDQSGPSPIVYYWFEREITVTVTHSGDPTQAEMDRLSAKGGVVILLIKAKSSASGAYYKEGFGTEDFRFDASSMLASAAPAKSSPAYGLVGVLGALAVVAAVARRRTV